MEPTVTVEAITLWQLVSYSGLYSIIAFPTSTLLTLCCIVGLIIHKTKRQFYVWILKTIIQFNLLMCALTYAFGVTKFWAMTKPFGGMMGAKDLFLENICEMTGGVVVLLFICLIAFITKTLAEVKQKYSANQSTHSITASGGSE